jgi:hypothetical protein
MQNRNRYTKKETENDRDGVKQDGRRTRRRIWGQRKAKREK